MNQLSFSSSSDGRRSLRRTHYVLKMDIESLLHLLSCHPRLFKQDAAGEQFVVSPSLIYDDWLCVNPYAVLGGGANGSGGDPEKRKREIEEQVREDLAKEEEEEQADEENEDRQKRGDSFMTGHDGDQPSGSSSASFEHEGRYLFRRDLTPRQAYRLWSTQLIGPDQNKNRPWEYHSESNHRGTLPAGHLLDLCENRVRFIRRGDPTAVHMLTVRTLEGIAYHIRTGCYNRRVNILQQALCSPHLRLEREVRKRFERKLLELMQYVKQERKFGYYQCKGCSARWRSGFTYDEIRQQCLKCFLWNKPFKLQPLLASSSSSQSAGVAAATPHTPGASLSTWQNRHRHRGESHSCHSSHINNRTREEMHNSSLASPQSLYREDRTEGGNEYRRRRGGGGGINQRTLAPASPCLVDSTPEPSAGRGNEFSHGSKLNDHRKNKGISPRPFNQQRGPSFLSLAYPSLRRQEERRSGHQDGDRHNNSYVSSSTLYSSFRSKKERQNDRRSQQDSSYTGAASSTSHRRAPEQLPGGHESRLTGAWPGQYQEARDANAKNTSVIHYKTLEEEKTHGGPSGCVGGGQTCSSHPGEGSDGSYGQTSEKTRGENGPVAHHSARGGGRRTRRLPGPPVKGVEVRGVPPRPGRQPFQENQTRHVFCEDDENGRGKITEGCGVPLLQLHEEYTSSALLNSINTEGPFKIQDSYRGDWISSHRTERQGLIATPMTIPKSSAGLLPYHPPSRHSPHHPLSPARPSTRRPLLHRGWESGGHGAGPELMHHSQPEARRQQGEEEACLFSSSLLSSSLMPSSGTLTGRDSSFCVRQQIEGRNSHSTRRGGGRGGGRGRRFLPPFTS
ncbi:hypothetical protein CSUI_011235 [Cystoisospora suis]|uniref:Uncharacterized protein n=1 Tax=Cystoisospora suis TaxID=483139 RepID=A0A2C6KF05_9APIC|nr:hypothetical protein CSUI_011235 [Cystoisospora suis]